MQGIGRIQEVTGESVKVDAKDLKIIYLLTRDSRMPLSEIAKHVMLSRDSVSYRIKRLQEKGVIQRFFPVLNYKYFNLNVFHVFMIIDERYKEEYSKLLEVLGNHPNVLSMMEYNDHWDIHVSLVAKNIRDFDSIMTDITTRFPNVIVEKDILENINNYKMEFLPYISDIKHDLKAVTKKPYSLDEKDLKILQVISNNTRLSAYEIGNHISVDADTVSYRIKKMIDAGIIKRFTTLVNFSKLKYHWYTFGIQMKTFDHKHEKSFQQYISSVPNIIRAVKTLGVWDVLLYIVVNDTKEFHRIIKGIKSQFYDITKMSEAWIAYREHFYNPMPKVLYDRPVA